MESLINKPFFRSGLIKIKMGKQFVYSISNDVGNI